MPQIRLQRPRIVALVCQRETAGVPQHMRMRLEVELRLNASPLHHAGKARRAEASSARFQLLSVGVEGAGAT